MNEGIWTHAVPEDRSDSLNSNPRGIAKSMFVSILFSQEILVKNLTSRNSKPRWPHLEDAMFLQNEANIFFFDGLLHILRFSLHYVFSEE